MADTPKLLLPMLAASQAQKHETVNEALVKLDVLVQLTVLDRDLATPPGSPASGDTYIVAASPTGAWVGHAGHITSYQNGWVFYVPSTGWEAWVVDEATSVVFNGTSWASSGGGGGSTFTDAAFTLTDDADATKIAKFQLSGITTGTTRTLTVPNADGTIAILSGIAQTFTTTTTFSGTLTASGATATIGTSTAASTYGVGTGATLSGNTKTINLGTAGVSGSTTVVNIGSAVAGALGTTVINTPTVTFANTVTAVGMPQANLTANLLGLGGATADATNRLSINTPAVLLNNAGAGIDMTFNKNAAGDDASMSFKTAFTSYALIGLLANNDFTIKVGTGFLTALQIDNTTGEMDINYPMMLEGQASAPSAPPTGMLKLYARDRAGTQFLDVQRSSGRDFPLQPHFGVNRVAFWAPSTTTTVTAVGMPVTNVGTVSTPTPASTNLKSSMRRWTLTSAAVINSVSDQRSAVNACWRGNAAGVGGFNYTNRLALTTLQATGMAFFGLYGSTAALATTLLLSGVVNCIGIGFQRGTHTNWQLVQNDAAGAPTLTDLGASFPINTTDVLTIYICAAPNGSEIGVRVINETSGAVFDTTVSSDIPASTVFLSPRNYMNNDTTAAAVAFDCAGVYLETDF